MYTGKSPAQRDHIWATVSAVLAGFVFWAFFQLSKTKTLAAISPFAEDPYDAVGSIAVQAAAGISVLTLARLAGETQAGAAPGKRRYILRGNLIVLLSIAVTLIADTVAVVWEPETWRASAWGVVLIGGLAVLAVLVLAGLLLLRQAAVSPELAKLEDLQAGMLGEALADVLCLVEIPARWAAARLPRLEPVFQPVSRFWQRVSSGVIRDANGHPWLFVFGIACATGVLTLSIHFIHEGFAPDLTRTLLIVVIFLGVEIAAVLAGFVALGGFLGLRPPLNRH